MHATSGNLLGHLIDDRYKLIDERGSGTFASVYITLDTVDNHLYAIKVLRLEEQPDDAEVIARFQREAFILQQLSDPHIVRIFDYGKDATLYYIVMDYIDGKTLREHMLPQQPMDLTRAMNYAQQVAEGLDATYKRGVVHRDLKPQNILINRRDVVKIVDFGLARGNMPTLTDVSAFMGTAFYISPEQVDNAHNTDIRADIYALTVILFEMLVGHPPFTGQSILDVLLQHNTAPVPLASHLRRDLPQDIDMFIQKGMAKLPSERFQTPREFIDALSQVGTIAQIQNQAYLVLPAYGRSEPLVGEKIIVGRYDPSQTRPDICLEEDKVGRRHACLRYRQGTYTVEDLGSKNKTRLNGEILPPGVERTLKHADVLQFGPIEGRFELRQP
jgi:serine/threonine protein kinase